MPKPIIQLNEENVKSKLKELVRNSVEETLNELLNKGAEELTSAAKYERTEARQGYRSGHYSRKLTTTSGDVRLEVPKLKGEPCISTAISSPLHQGSICERSHGCSKRSTLRRARKLHEKRHGML